MERTNLNSSWNYFDKSTLCSFSRQYWLCWSNVQYLLTRLIEFVSHNLYSVEPWDQHNNILLFTSQWSGIFLPKWFRKILECGSYIVGGWLGWKVGLSENRSAFNSHWHAEHKWPLRNNFPLDSSSWLSESIGNKFQRDGIGWSLQWDSADMSIAVRWHW